MRKHFRTFALTISILGTLSSCTAGLPKPLPYPVVKQKTETLKILGLQESGQNTTTQMVSVRKENGTFEPLGAEMPVRKAQLIDVFERANIASHYLLDGPSDYQVVIEKSFAKGDNVFLGYVFAPLSYILALIPFPEVADGEIILKVYDGKGGLIDVIDEKGRTSYCNWLPLVVAHWGDKKANELYGALNDRAAIRAIEVLQKKIEASTPTRVR